MSFIQRYLQTKWKKPRKIMCEGDFGNDLRISAMQGSGLKYSYNINNLREMLHNICANVNLLHGHFNVELTIPTSNAVSDPSLPRGWKFKFVSTEKKTYFQFLSPDGIVVRFAKFQIIQFSNK